LSAKGNFSVRLGRELWVGDEVVGVGNIQTCPHKQFALTFRLDGHFSTEERVDDVCGIDILMTRISILFIIVIFTIASLVVPEAFSMSS